MMIQQSASATACCSAERSSYDLHRSGSSGLSMGSEEETSSPKSGQLVEYMLSQ